MIKFILTSVITLGLSATASAYDNTEITKAEVPGHVLKTAEYYAPGVEFTRFGYEIEDGQKVYEFEAHRADGLHIEVDVFANGKLDEIEMQKHWHEVPEAIKTKLMATYPGFEVGFIEASIRPTGVFVYEFEGSSPNQDFIDVEIIEEGDSIDYLTN